MDNLSRTHRNAVVATIIGNGFAWFDFTCYGFFAVIIAKLFFPTAQDSSGLLLAMITFGVGFVMRPFGGVFLGIYADKVGRKAALSLTMLLMSIGTALIAFAPTYEQIGVWAQVIIVMSRLFQGFSAGGEMSSAAAFLTEYAPKGKKGYYTSWIQASIGFAILLAAAVGSLISTLLTEEELYSWGWRLPFLFGLLIGPIGLYIRNQTSETEKVHQEKCARTPLRDIMKFYPKEICVGFALVVLWTTCSYVLLFYIPTYSISVLGLSTSSGFTAVILGGAMVFIFSPIFGALSDRFVRSLFLSFSSLAICLLAYPMFLLLNIFPSLLSLLLFQFVFGLFISCYQGPVLAVVSGLFPEKLMSIGISISYNLAVMLFGGFAATVITWLISTTGNQLAPAFYVIAAAMVSFVATLFIGDRKNKFFSCPVMKASRVSRVKPH